MHFLNAGPTFKIKSYRINEKIVSIEEKSRKKRLHITISNLGHNFFSQKMSYFLLKDLKSVFFVKISSFSNIFDLNRKILPCFKRKKNVKKIRGFVDS